MGEDDVPCRINPEISLTYDPVALDAYWQSRPVKLISRTLTIVFEVKRCIFSSCIP